MKRCSLRFKELKLFVVGLFFLGFMGSFAALSYAEAIETAKQQTDNVLNGIENYFEKTGLPDLRNKINEQYQLYIKPYFKSQYELTSNVFKAPDDNSNNSDSIWSFIPGFQFLHKNRYGLVGGAYEATFRYFSRFPEQNEQDQKFLVYANLNPTDNIYVNVSEQMEQQGATAGSSAFNPVNYFDNTVGVTVGLVSGILTHEFSYENFDRDYQSSLAKRYSHNDNTYSYTLYGKLNEVVRVYGGAKIGFLYYDKMGFRDTTWVEFPIGIQGELVLGWTGNVSVGLHRRNVEDSNQNDRTHIVTNISVNRKLNQDKSDVELGFLRHPVESTFSTTTAYDEKLWHASGRHLLTEKLRARATIFYANRDFQDRVFTGTRVVAGGAVFTVPGGIVQRVDNAFGLGFGFDYNLRKWLILHADYRFERRDSNVAGLDFTENAMVLKSSIPL